MRKALSRAQSKHGQKNFFAVGTEGQSVMMRQGFFRSFRRARDGVVAMEFALVALPFFMMIFGIFELSLYYASATVLEGATVAASRVIRTGQAQAGANPEEVFKNILCDNVSTLISCASLVYEVRHPPGNSFNDADGLAPQYDASGNLISHGFDPGAVSDVVVVRVTYRYKFATIWLGSLLANNADHSALIQSTVTIRNEPYEFED